MDERDVYEWAERCAAYADAECNRIERFARQGWPWSARRLELYAGLSFACIQVMALANGMKALNEELNGGAE